MKRVKLEIGVKMSDNMNWVAIDEDAKDHLPRLRNQVTCNNWSEWTTCFHNF